MKYMFNVVISDESIFKIDSFIDSYRNSFLIRFLDTWIFNENLIRKNYIDLSKEFRNNIYFEVEKILSKDIILWRMIQENSVFSTFINIWNYRILLKYNEDIENKIRLLIDINFYK